MKVLKYYSYNYIVICIVRYIYFKLFIVGVKFGFREIYVVILVIEFIFCWEIILNLVIWKNIYDSVVCKV